MKRDMDLLRHILIELDQCDETTGHELQELSVGGHSAERLSYHVMLLCQAGLIDAKDLSTCDPEGFRWLPKRLTWAGHEFLEKARTDSLWEKAKKIALEKTGGLNFDVLKQVLGELVTQATLGS
jgi:hypothetical protein